MLSQISLFISWPNVTSFMNIVKHGPWVSNIVLVHSHALWPKAINGLVHIHTYMMQSNDHKQMTDQKMKLKLTKWKWNWQNENETDKTFHSNKIM